MARKRPSDDPGWLRDRWLGLLAGLGAKPTAALKAFDQLSARYAEPQRHYHTIEHIGHVLQAVDALCETVRPRDHSALLLAVYFHDAIYDPRAADNEERSAVVAAAGLKKLGVTKDTIAVVRELILKTKHHDAGEGDIDGQILIDADLGILGASPAMYDRYAQAIRCEYAWVLEDAYRAGRSAVLKKFLERPHIYRTPTYQATEARARRNLRREVRLLERSSP
ncbi:MAG: hypothetical protein K2R98_12145 [Gemmataceae bacterium]|nr:hypothetical protein [Gemmataceae bacterium]